MLGAVDDQHIFRVRGKAAAGQIASDNFTFREPSAMRLVAQMSLDIPYPRQLPERLAQRILCVGSEG